MEVLNYATLKQIYNRYNCRGIKDHPPHLIINGQLFLDNTLPVYILKPTSIPITNY